MAARGGGDDPHGGWTREEPVPGVVIWQPQRGFRYGAEAFWLAGFALEGGPVSRAIDLGTGSGIVAALLAAQGVDAVGIDVRPEWTAGWDRSRRDSKTAFPALSVRDVASLGADERFDVAVSNPPYFPVGSGPAAPDPWKAAARTEAGRTVGDFVRAAVRVAARACFVVPVEREGDVLAASAVPARRLVRVGHKRVLIELAATDDPPVIEVLDESAAQRWYARVRGVHSGQERS